MAKGLKQKIRQFCGLSPTSVEVTGEKLGGGLTNATNNETFWKPIKSIFSEKCLAHNKIILVGQDLILDKNENLADVLNHFFFINLVPNLNIPSH